MLGQEVDGGVEPLARCELERLTEGRAVLGVLDQLADGASGVAERGRADRGSPLHRCGLRAVEALLVLLPLHPGDAQEDLASEAAFGGRDVELLGGREDHAPGGGDIVEEGDALTRSHASQAVELRDDQAAEATLSDAVEDAVEDRPTGLGAGDVQFGLEDDQLEALRLGVTLDRGELKLGGAEPVVVTVADSGDAPVRCEGKGQIRSHR